MNRHFSKDTDGQNVYDKMFNNQRNTNQNYMRYHLTLVRMAIISKSTNNKCWRGCGENEFLLHCWSDCKLVRPLWRTVWKFLKKLKLTTTRFNNPVPAFSKSSLYI